MTARPSRPETLGRVVARRIVLFALIAMVAQSAWMLWRYLGDPDHMADHLVDMEVDALSEGVKLRDGQVTFELPPGLAGRYGGAATGYAARVRGPDGATLWRSCDEACIAKAFPIDEPLASSWMRRNDSGYPLSVKGGHEVLVGGRSVYVEAAIDEDPDGVVANVIIAELVEEMLLPTGVALAFAIGASLYSIGRSLAPVSEAARAAGGLDPLGPIVRLDAEGMPLEVARFVDAVNRSYGRVRELVAAQRLFTAAISHEIRTPLAAIRLELERVDHPRARRATAELDELVAFVEQLTALARIEAADRPVTAPVDLTAALREVVAGVAPWVFDKGATIALVEDGAAAVNGDERLIRNAARNLVENAVRHGGKGVAVTVRAGPGAAFSVEDDGRDAPAAEEIAAPGQARLGDGLGVGLEIVRRIAAMHDARFEIAPLPPRGVGARLLFPEASAAPRRTT
ncbi:sensor histidine kinase [Chenggangzhangella methanolivorans]|uniref:histidine kinase n=1 Tax=Chenggangzhangella methanolivorans TaxID=1437009 RepID=A0A9E6RCU0_9HYPH|nr:HAMP domain-containing sensor histidine kinase [Chenggangzhangella methanolivorans]QZO01932.1 HAMP domain-containing histidine kinase [Chenggangzhangella methanolivorans]